MEAGEDAVSRLPAVIIAGGKGTKTQAVSPKVKMRGPESPVNR